MPARPHLTGHAGLALVSRYLETIVRTAGRTVLKITATAQSNLQFQELCHHRR